MDHTVLFCLSSAASCDAEETLGVCVWGSVPTNELGLESCVAKKDRSLPLHVLFPPLGMPFPFTSAPTCPYLSGKLPPIFQGAVQGKPLAPHTLLLPTPRPSYPSFCNCRIDRTTRSLGRSGALVFSVLHTKPPVQWLGVLGLAMSSVNKGIGTTGRDADRDGE